MDKFSVPRPERESYRKHRQQFTWQIVFPVVLATLLGAGFAVLAGIGAQGSHPAVSLWADISLIWLIIPMMLLAIVILAVTLGLVYGLARLLKVSPYYTGLAQEYVLWISAEISLWTEKLTKPVLMIKSWLDLLVRSKEQK